MEVTHLIWKIHILHILFSLFFITQFKDLVKDLMVAEHDIVTKSLIKDDFDADDIFNDKKATKQIELHLQSLEFNSTRTNLLIIMNAF